MTLIFNFQKRIKVTMLPYLLGYWGILLSRMSTNNKISSIDFAIIQLLPFLSSLKAPDMSYKVNVDFGIVLERKNTMSYNRKNMVNTELLLKIPLDLL